MKFSIVLLAIPAMALAKPEPTSTTTSAAPSGTPLSRLEQCEKQAYDYAEYCPRCMHNCDEEQGQAYEQCIFGVIWNVNGVENRCKEDGGSDCTEKAVDEICGQ